MKRLAWIGIAAAVLGLAIWAAVNNTESAAADPAKLLPDGVLLFLEARDFQGLLNDWNSSSEKRAWLKGDNYAAFSRSRLYERLSQAQGEFSTAATIPTDESLLTSVAGHQSALALYDIGNLEFVYLTRMDQAQAESTPLWRVRDKFEQRTEGAAQFFVHQNVQSSRTAAFAVRDGWLVLGTRADLVAGVLDRLQGGQAHSLSDEDWYADAFKQAKEPIGDLRMVINLEKVVPSPYFRSYWVHRNITEMKQYRAALCDLHRTNQEYREDRALLRKPGAMAAASGDASSLLAVAPDDAVFAWAVASPAPERILAEMRENILDLKPERAQIAWSAPQAATPQNAGSASDLETRIDVAPVIVAQSDPYQPMRTMLASTQPAALLEVFVTRAPKDQMFVAIDRGIVIQSASPWNVTAFQNAIGDAVRPGLTASQLGVEWAERPASGGSYYALSGQVQIFFAIRNTELLVATSESLLQSLLSRTLQITKSSASGVTYTAVFRHPPSEQQNYRKILNRLDSAGSDTQNPQNSDDDAEGTQGRVPPFFSGNIDSLSRTFSDVILESIEEKDQGELVTQTVLYEWKHQ
jgi:hypothetical protein